MSDAIHIPREALELVTFAGQDDTRPILHYIHLKRLSPQKMRACATDGSCLGWYEWEDATTQGEIWLRADRVRDVLKASRKEGSVLLRDGQLVAGSTVIANALAPDLDLHGREIKRTFPDVESLFNNFPTIGTPKLGIDLALFHKVYNYTRQFKGYKATVEICLPENQLNPILITWYECQFLIMPTAKR